MRQRSFGSPLGAAAGLGVLEPVRQVVAAVIAGSARDELPRSDTVSVSSGVVRMVEDRTSHHT